MNRETLIDPHEQRLAVLTTLASAARTFLEPHWEAWYRHIGSPEGQRTFSEGTCGRSSTFLCDLLRSEGYSARVAYGSPVECDCGFRTAAGWKGHGWVVVEDPACIIDLTADQFGAPPVIVTGLDDPRFCEGHDVAGQGWIAQRQRAAKDLMQDWQVRGLAWRD